MILFMLNKTFFDFWDNLFSIFLLNFGCTLIVGAGIYVTSLLGVHPVTFFLGILITVVMFSLYVGAAALVARDIADYKSPTFKSFFQYLKEVWPAALGFMLLGGIQLVIFSVILPWYFRLGNLIGILVAGLLFWISVIWVFASQYYFPVRSRLDSDIKKVFRKSVLVFFDNTAFTLFLGCGTLVLLVLSGFTAFLLPGIGTILLWHQVGLKLRLYKYEYLETHPEAQRRNIPWDTLLQDEKERIGPRTLRGMIFPWKE